MMYFDEHPEDFEIGRTTTTERGPFAKGDDIYNQQKGFSGGAFEQLYLSIRTKEDRTYSDSELKELPRIWLDHPRYNEWQVRARSAKRLAKQLMKEKPKLVLEVGCGNGWLVNFLQWKLKVPIIGADIVRAEIAQASRVFWDGWAHFVYGDVLSDAFQGLKPDAIILAASAQYFPDFRYLINRLRTMLNDGGRIHIIDTPFYKTNEIANAKLRSEEYFRSQGYDEMKKFYFHQDINVLKEFKPKFLYRPSTITRLLNKYNSPFPYLLITSAPRM